MKRIISLLLVIISLVLLSGCSSDTTTETNSENDEYSKDIVGTWEINDANYKDKLTFNEDGSYEETITEFIGSNEVTFNVEGQWKIKEFKLYWAATTVDGQTEDEFKKLGDVELTEAEIEKLDYFFSGTPSEINMAQNRLIITNQANEGRILSFTRVDS